MKELIKTFEEFPLIVKIILALPFLDIIWSVYRLIKALDGGNTVAIVVWIVLLIVGVPFMWVVDLIWILLKGNAFYYNF